MISPEMELQWMNVKEEQVKTTSVFDLFKENSHRMMRIKNGYKEIRFSPGELKITDWRGWTDIEYIRKVEAITPSWIQISAGQQSILVSEHEEIPVYTSISPRKGFHGASVYNYQLKRPYDIDPLTDFLRIRRGIDLDEIPIEFDHPSLQFKGRCHSDFGYEIGTRSKFFNCNNVHIFGSDTVPDKMEVSR